jgi:hypothetical protein
MLVTVTVEFAQVNFALRLRERMSTPWDRPTREFVDLDSLPSGVA